MNNYILFQVYGSKSIFDECKFFLLRFAALASEWEMQHVKVLIYTTDKNIFRDYISILPNIVFENVTESQINKWRGDINFVHRVKIEVISHFFSNYTGNLLYCDTDTYPVKPLQSVFTHINEGAVYMHTCEGNIGQTNQFKKWHRFLKENSSLDFLQKNNASIAMWNAGVIGFGNNNKDVLPDVLQVTDTIYPLFKKHAVEQFAFSYLLQKKHIINAAENYIYHYWNLKEFRILLSLWFLKNKEKSIKELIVLAQDLSPEKISIDKFAYLGKPFFVKMMKKIRSENWKIENYFPKH